MNPLILLLSVSSGTLLGAAISGRLTRKQEELAKLRNALTVMQNEICNYGAGLSQAASYAALFHKCTLIRQLSDTLKQPSGNNTPLQWSALIEGSGFPPEVRTALNALFGCVERFDSDAIFRQFDTTIATVAQYEEALRAKNLRFVPLYRKIGLLGGIALAILLM